MTKSPLISVEEIAGAENLPLGKVLYLLHLPDAPRPVRRKSRERLWDRAEVATYLRIKGIMQC